MRRMFFLSTRRRRNGAAARSAGGWPERVSFRHEDFRFLAEVEGRRGGKFLLLGELWCESERGSHEAGEVHFRVPMNNTHKFRTSLELEIITI